MAERTRRILAATLQGYPLLEEIEEFTPTNIEKTMEASRGGRFVARELMVGLENMASSIVLNGADSALFADLNPQAGEDVELYVRESWETEDGEAVSVKHEITGTVNKVESRAVKMGEFPQRTIELAVIASKRTEGDTLIHDINVRTQKVDLGQGDLMEAHRRAAEV